MSSAATTAPKIDGAYLRARLGSFLAVMPLGMWVLLHLWNNLAAFRSAQAWQTQVTEYSHPLAQFGTLLLVLLPLALHTIWGIRRLASTKPNIVRYGFFANLKYIVQRLSAIGLLLFLGAHLWKAMLEPRYVKGHPESFADIAYMMHHHGPTLAVYVLAGKYFVRGLTAGAVKG